MRFTRRPRSPYTVTDRKRAAAVRRQRREREVAPLLAPLIAERQPAVETLMRERVERWTGVEQAWRDRRAVAWRRARARLAGLPDEQRTAMLRYWNGHRWLPGDPSYLLDCLHSLGTGRLVVKGGEIEPARVTISIAEATAVEGSRKPVAGGWLGRRP